MARILQGLRPLQKKPAQTSPAKHVTNAATQRQKRQQETKMFRKLFEALEERKGIGKGRGEIRSARGKKRDQKGKRKLEQGRGRKEKR